MAEETPSRLLVIQESESESIAPPTVQEPPAGDRVLSPETFKVTHEEMEALTREARRRVTLDLAERMYKTDHQPLVPPQPFDKSDVRCQRYIRMAECVFEWMVKR